MRRTPVVLLVLLGLLLVGCGGSGSSGSSGGAVTGGSATPTLSPSASPGATAAAACPTENTRNFAKTRFVADVGGAAFLVNRYIYRPYRDGAFTRGAQGRTVALIKAGAAAAASAKLLSNARKNAEANPTLCRTVAAPLGRLTDTLGGLTTSLREGTFDPRVVGGLGGEVDRLLERSGDAGVPVEERPTRLR